MNNGRAALVELSLAALDGAIIALEDVAARFGDDRQLTLREVIDMLKVVAEEARKVTDD